MSFGAHETMDTHEILMEKISTITHFNLYGRQARNRQLQDMIARQQQEMIRSYNELVSLTRQSARTVPMSPPVQMRGVSPQDVQYGLHNPQPIGPQADATLNDVEIASAMLICHKNGAKNAMWASLECADPNVRRALLNSAVSCNNQAYEVFLFMNQNGVYQVPTLSDHTAQTLLHHYQPAGGTLQSQYGVTAGPMGVMPNQMMMGTMGTMQFPMAGTTLGMTTQGTQYRQ